MTTVPPASTTPNPALPAQVSSFTNTHDHADTFGWDTVFAVTFTNANKAIQAGWGNVNAGAKNFSQAASDDPSFHIDAVFGPWQLTEGGDGKNIRMLCPVISGTYTTPENVFDLSQQNMQIVIEVGMEWIPDPDQKNFQLTGSEVGAVTAALNEDTISDQLRAEFAAHGMSLTPAAAALVILQGKEWGITDGSTNYYLFEETDKDGNVFLFAYQYEKAWMNNLNLLKRAVNDDDPAVVIITVANDPSTGIAAAVLPELCSTWFNTNIGQFNHVFATLGLTPVLAQDDRFAWMQPTATSYAVTDQGSLDTSIFGVLTMTGDRQPGTNHQVSPFAIPPGTDAGFLISGPLFMQNMLLSGAQTIFNGAPASSFSVTNDGLTIQNTEELIWGKFMLDNQKQGSIAAVGTSQLDNGQISPALFSALTELGIELSSSYSATVTDQGSQWLLSDGQPGDDEYILELSDDQQTIDVWIATIVTIAAGQFQMTLSESFVQIQFIDLVYPFDSSYNVNVNFTDQVQLSLRSLGNKQIFWFTEVVSNLEVNVTETQAAVTRQIVEDAVLAVLTLVAVLGPIIQGLSAGAEVGAVSAEAGDAAVDADAFASTASTQPDSEAANEEAAAAAAATRSTGRLTQIKNAFQTPRWQFVASLAALAGAVKGFDVLISDIIKNAAQNEWENVPAFSDFSDQAISPYAFPNVAGFTLSTAWLAGSLQVGFTINSPS